MQLIALKYVFTVFKHTTCMCTVLPQQLVYRWKNINTCYYIIFSMGHLTNSVSLSLILLKIVSARKTIYTVSEIYVAWKNITGGKFWQIVNNLPNFARQCLLKTAIECARICPAVYFISNNLLRSLASKLSHVK